jgi:hypothetical protein
MESPNPEGNSIPEENLENLQEQKDQTVVEGNLQFSGPKSLDFSNYNTAKGEFEAKQQVFKAEEEKFKAEEEKFKAEEEKFKSVNITPDQQKSLVNHNLDYNLISLLKPKPLPTDSMVHDFDKAIFVGFYNNVKEQTSGPDVFLKKNGYFTTVNYDDVNPATAANPENPKGPRIPIFIDNEGYRFVSIFTGIVKTTSQRLLARGGGKSKKRVKRNSNNKSKRRYKK